MRYADDAVVLCRSKADAEESLRRLGLIMDRLGLKLHPDKTRIVELGLGKQGFVFLGCYLRIVLSQVKGSPTSATRIIRRSAHAGSKAEEEAGKTPRSERLRALLPDLWELVRTRRGALALGLVLMAINRVSGLVLPASTKYLIDDVIGKRQTELLLPIVGAVLAATLIQGTSSFALTQILSKAAQRLIAEMRLKVQSHVGRLPVTYSTPTRRASSSRGS